MTPNNKAKRLRILPPNDKGIVSPYPTVVTVIIAHQMASGIVFIGSLALKLDGKTSGSIFT